MTVFRENTKIREMRGLYEYSRYDLVAEELWHREGDGAPLLECRYGAADRGYVWLYFWYKSLPPKFNGLVSLDKEGHLRLLGKKTLKTCPATRDEALAMQQANSKDMGF